MAVRPAITPRTTDGALDGTPLRYRRGIYPPEPGATPVPLVEADLLIDGIGTERITRRVSDIPVAVFNSVTDTNPRTLYMKQTRAVLEWLRSEAGLAQ